MRITPEEITTLKIAIQNIDSEFEVYLFGSRTDPNKRGGDIDILVLGERTLTLPEIAAVELDFWRKFGEQKIDIVSFTKDSDASFKHVALDSAIRL